MAIALSLIIIALYWQTLDHGFVFDDGLYVSENAVVQRGLTLDNIAWSFSLEKKEHKIYWHPVTWLSHMIDVELFGLNPLGHHLVNIFIHLANTLLLFTLLFRTTGALWESAMVAALFAIHPINVESVAWIAERKNLLSTFFFMLTLHSYVRYAIRPRLLPYLLTCAVFGLGLMTKPMLITIPFVLLLLDYWPLARWQFSQKNTLQLIIEKIPLALLAVGVLIISIQSLAVSNNLRPTAVVPLFLRVENALVSYFDYIGKLFWPANLAVFYPFPSEIVWWKGGAALGVLLLITAFVLTRVKRRPALFIGWFWYVGTLIPVSGLIQTGMWPAMADRWAYIPCMGLFIGITWEAAVFCRSRPQYRKVWGAVLVGILFAMAGRTWFQLHHWQNSLTLNSHAIRFAGNDYVINLNLANALRENDLPEEAIYYYKRAMLLNSDNYKAHLGVSKAFIKKRMYEEAEKHLQLVLRIKPEKADLVHFNLAATLESRGKIDAARNQYRMALSFDPKNPEIYYGLGRISEKTGQWAGAEKNYDQAIRHDPNFYKAYNALGVILARQNNFREAVSYFQKALHIKPNDKMIQLNLDRALKMVSGVTESPDDREGP